MRALLLLLVAALVGGEERQPPKELLLPHTSPQGIRAYVDASRAAGYAGASAHAPAFPDKKVWPLLSGKERFLRTTWPKARLLVWAHPGRSGGPRFGKESLDPTDPKNWVEEGKPASRLDLGPEVDLLLPASSTPYSVGFRDTPVREVVRHLTIESGAAFIGGGDGAGRTFYGNVWIKAGGGMSSQGPTRFPGGADTFFRNDSMQEWYHAKGRWERYLQSQYFEFSRGEGSVEFLGCVAVLDEFMINNGTVIVGPDSKLCPGRNASPIIQAQGTLALMDGASFMKWANEFQNRDMECSGAILGGLPERPLTRSCTFWLNKKNTTEAQYEGPGAEMYRGKIVRYPRVPSMVLRSGARVLSHTADPKQAHLVFAWPGEMMSGTWRPESLGHKVSDEDRQRFAWFMALPAGISVAIEPDVKLTDVEFDAVQTGGLILPDAGMKSVFASCIMGPHNHATGDALFTIARLKGISY